MAGEENVVVLATQGTIQKIRDGAVARLASDTSTAAAFAAVAQIGGDRVDARPTRVDAARFEVQHRGAAILAERFLGSLVTVTQDEALLVGR